MSQIFDALHRSEAERQRTGPHAFKAATELLEAAERQLARGSSEGAAPITDHEAGKVNPFESARLLLPSQTGLACRRDADSLVAEKFRFLGVRLKHIQQKRPLKRLLITSSMPEEGKSTVAANLAGALATRQQQRILLLEGDLRRPTLAAQFGIGTHPGLGECLEGETSLAMSVCRLDGWGFWILQAGALPSDPLALIQSEKLPLLMDELNLWFDWVIIDSPPLLPLADTSVWMRLADAILLVTRPGKTGKRQLQRSLEVLEQPKLLGALVNGSREATSSSYYYQGDRQSVPTTATPVAP